jgi:hypothetical protein
MSVDVCNKYMGVEMANAFDLAVDEEDPFDAHYYDLNYVPWYARMSYEDLIAYLDWIIAKREAQNKAWREDYARAHGEHPTHSSSRSVSLGSTAKC